MSLAPLRPEGDRGIDLLTRLYDERAEQALLGSLLFANKSYEYVVDIVRREDFGNALHASIFMVIGSLVEKGQEANPVTVWPFLREDKALNGAGGWRYLKKLCDCVVTTVNAPDYAKYVSDLAHRRELVIAARDMIADAARIDVERPAETVLDDAEEMLFDISERRRRGIGPALVGDGISGVIADIEQIWKEGKPRALATGLVDLDRILGGGLAQSEVIVLGGRPSMGKSAFASTVAWNVAKGRDGRKKVVAFFSLEMPTEDLTSRWLAGATGLSTQRQRTGQLVIDDFQSLIEAGDELRRLPILVDDQPRLSVAQIRQRARRIRRRYGLDLIVIDYLQYIRLGKPGDRIDRRIEVGEASNQIKSLAKELKVPILLVSQLSRALESRDDKRPMLADLRECVIGETLVCLADGRRRPIKELVGTAPEVVSVDDLGNLCCARASIIWKVGERDVFKITLASGRSIIATKYHKLFAADGWKAISDLKTGDRLAASRRVPDQDNALLWPEHWCVLLGHLIGDGSYISNKPLRYTTANIHCSEAVKAAAEKFGCTVNRHEGTGKWHQLVISGNGNRWHPSGVNKWLRDLGVFGQRSTEKRVPGDVFRLRNDQVSLFLRHLWATDGHISGGNVEKKSGPSAYFATASRGLAEDVAFLLLRFEIFARISQVENCHQVWIRGTEALARFLDLVGAFGPKIIQAEALRRRLKGRTANTNVDTLPIEIFDQIKSAMKSLGISQRRMATMRGTSYGGDAHFGFSPSRATVLSYAALLNLPKLAIAASNDLFWDQIVSISPAGRAEVFDLTVPETHSWLADGIISHNSGDIEQDADVVLFLYRDEYYLERSEPRPRADRTAEVNAQIHLQWQQTKDRTRNLAEIIVAKNRHGRLGTVTAFFDGERQRFNNLSRSDTP